MKNCKHLNTENYCLLLQSVRKQHLKLEAEFFWNMLWTINWVYSQVTHTGVEYLRRGSRGALYYKTHTEPRTDLWLAQGSGAALDNQASEQDQTKTRALLASSNRIRQSNTIPPISKFKKKKENLLIMPFFLKNKLSNSMVELNQCSL